MENCKNCGEELEENSPVCPDCGMDEANPPEEEKTADVTEAAADVAEETAETTEEPAESAEEAAQPDAVEETAGEEVQMQKGIVLTPGKLAALVIVFVLLVAALVGLVVMNMSKKPAAESADADAQIAAGEEQTEPATLATVPADGNPDNETCKGTYTASDADVAAAANTVVARAGDQELTNEQLQIFYGMEVNSFMKNYGAYATYFGLDTAQSFDTQRCGIIEENRTWQQYFLGAALESWHNYQSLTAEAEKAGIAMQEDYQTSLDNARAELEASAKAAGFADEDELVKRSMGQGATVDGYLHFNRLYVTGLNHYGVLADSVVPTDEEIEAYFEKNAEMYGQNGVTKDTVTVDVRHILLFPEGASSETIRTEEYPEEAWTASETKAQQILDEWLAGDKTEESFAQLAAEYSQDGGSQANGGLYTGVTQGQMVPAFDEWCFDPARQVGDYGIVKTEYGYHIMYFCGSKTVWQETAAGDLKMDRTYALVDEIVAKYPISVDYKSIVLSELNLGAE